MQKYLLIVLNMICKQNAHYHDKKNFLYQNLLIEICNNHFNPESYPINIGKSLFLSLLDCAVLSFSYQSPYYLFMSFSSISIYVGYYPTL